MTKKQPYAIRLNTQFGASTLIDIPTLIEECRERWFNQTLCRVNDCVVRLGIVRGEFHWHKHKSEDEFFLILEGRLLIDLKNKTVELGPHQGYTVSRNVVHRTRAPKKAVILMIEGAGVNPTGD